MLHRKSTSRILPMVRTRCSKKVADALERQSEQRNRPPGHLGWLRLLLNRKDEKPKIRSGARSTSEEGDQTNLEQSGHLKNDSQREPSQQDNGRAPIGPQRNLVISIFASDADFELKYLHVLPKAFRNRLHQACPVHGRRPAHTAPNELHAAPPVGRFKPRKQLRHAREGSTWHYVAFRAEFWWRNRHEAADRGQRFKSEYR